MPKREESHPFLQLLLLFVYAVAGFAVCSGLALALIISIYGIGFLSDLSTLSAGDIKYLDALKILQTATTIGAFILPPVLLALTERRKLNSFYQFKKPNSELLGIVFLIMLVSMPLMEFTTLLNQRMALPGFLKPLENWMRAKEAEAMKMTIQFLTVRNNFDFVVNLIMIAVLPGIAEELMFRGGVQRSLGRMFNNAHLAIWLSAILFSTIHMQFFGFIPRLLLGAGFGYIYYWTGSLWYAMLAHFLNNAYAVCVAFYMQKNNIPLDEADHTSNFAWYGYVISLILTIALFKFLKDKTTSRERKLG